ncbi:hypothetical protein EUX98_g2331 [Antrodiella citrinella]|uniref:Zn(2)-C6 fungal-type domain-containing protein n=1 Tax=Antrodiella citrinella TaxID=2447956 RepID=A0A4S4N1H6_9APHY|nr:hypothetical protein EUX98_g2331 [Antrodiella citrinella]
MKADSPLQRGKACLCCRKRKMKCDGVRPICTQCVKASRSPECKYHDKKQISRTQLLQQKVAKLEARLRELESEQSDFPDGSPTPSFVESMASSSSSSSPSVTLAHPVKRQDGASAQGAEWPSQLFDDGAGFNDFNTSFPLYPSHPSQSPSTSGQSSDLLESSSLYLPNTFSSSSVYSSPMVHHAGPSTLSNKWWEDPNTFCQQKQMLLDMFLAHRHQFAFDTHIERFQASISYASPDKPHPALMDAIYLMSCHLSQSPPLTELEPHFLKRALCGISDALQHNDRVINVLQASCLLALYFFGRGRILEGYYHSSIAARLAVSLGLHQIRSDSWFQLQFTAGEYQYSAPPPSSNSAVQLHPPKDAIESEERVAAFWQVFVVDRAWSVATGLPAALPDDDHPQAQIETVWPTPLSQFPNVLNDSSQRYDPVTSYPTLRAKAVALFEKTHRLTSSTTSTKNETYWVEHRALEMSLSQFASNLPGLGMSAGQGPFSLNEIDLFVIHTLIHVSTLHLHRDLAKTQAVAYEKCWIAANKVISLVRELNDGDYDYLDPINSACWHCTADVFIKTLVPPTSHTRHNANEIADQQIDVLIAAMKRLGRLFPIAGTSHFTTHPLYHWWYRGMREDVLTLVTGIHATKTGQHRTATRNSLGIP